MTDLYIKEGKRYKKVLTDVEVSSGDDYENYHHVAGNFYFIADAMSLSPGLWLSTQVPGCKTLSKVKHLSDIPSDPYTFTQILNRRDDLLKFLKEYTDAYAKKTVGWYPSNTELVEALLGEVTRLAGITGTGKIETNSQRRLDPEL